MSIGPFIIPNLFDLYLYVQCNILTLYRFIFIHSPYPLDLDPHFLSFISYLHLYLSSHPSTTYFYLALFYPFPRFSATATAGVPYSLSPNMIGRASWPNSKSIQQTLPRVGVINKF